MLAIVQALAHPVNFTAPKLKQSRQFPVSKPVLVLTGIFVVAVFAFVYFYISLKSSGLVTLALSENTRRLLQKLPRDEAVIAPARLEEADAEMAPFSDDELNEALSDYPPKLNGLAYALLHSDKLARSEYWFERIEHYLKNTNRSRPELMLMVEYGLASSKGPAQSIEAINVIEQAMPGKAADFVNPQLRSEFLRLYVQRIDRATAQCEGDEQKIEGVRTRALKFFQRYHDDPALASASARCLRETRLILPPQPVRNLLHDLNWGKGTVTVSETSIRAVENALPRISRMKLDPAELVGLHTALADRFSRGLNRDKAIYYNDLALKELHAPETDLSNDLRANYYLIAQTYNRVKKQHQADAICRELLSTAGAPNTVGYAARLSEWGTVKEAGYERGDSPPSDKYLEAAAIADAAKDVDPLGIEPAMYRAYAMDSLSALEHNPKKASEIAKTLSAKVETWSKGSQSAGRKEALMGRVTNGLQKYYSRIGEKDKARHIGELEHKLVRAVYWYQE